jgi:protein ECT2
MRSRAAIFGLDVIGRNLFGQGINIKGDLFGSVSSSRRTKSTRSSVYTDGSLARFSRSNSTTTVATTVSDGESSLLRNRSIKPGGSKQQKLIKRKSPAPILPEDELPLRSRTQSEPSPARSVDRGLADDDREILGKIPAPDFDRSGVSDDSEWALTENLKLARHNSKSQSQPIARQRSFLEEPIEETIYEGWLVARNAAVLELTVLLLRGATCVTAFLVESFNETNAQSKIKYFANYQLLEYPASIFPPFKTTQ